MSISRAVVPDAPSSAPRSSSTLPISAPSSITPTRFSSAVSAARYVRDPLRTSAAPASSQSGEKPKAVIDPSSTTLPATFRFASSAGSGSPSGTGFSTLPTSSIATRSRFFAVAS